MRIGIVVDGESELRALPLLYRELWRSSRNRVVGTALGGFDPQAPTGNIARWCAKQVRILEATRQAQRAIVLLDREDRRDPPCVIARAIEAAVEDLSCTIPAQVVVKDRQFENWLIADLAPFEGQPARFELTAGLRSQVEPDRADRANAGEWLRRACTGSYHKKDDSARILSLADPMAIARNSRSFRRFLRVIGHRSYTDQSRTPGS